MNIFKKSVLKNILGSVLVIGAASSVIAAPVSIGSGVQAITLITLVASGEEATDFKAGDYTGVLIASGVIDSNVANGFIITVGSDNGGSMRRAGGGVDVGSNVTYSHYELIQGASGLLGEGASPFERKAIPALNNGSVSFRSGAVKSATVKQEYSLKVFFTASDDVLAGAYTDTISLAIASGW